MGNVKRTDHKLTEKNFRCGHCGIEALMLIVCEGEHTVTEEDAQYGTFWLTDYYRLLLCPSCNNVNLIQTSYDSEHVIDISDDEVDYEVVVKHLFPFTSLGNFKNLPNLVKKSYAIAIKLKKLEPMASVVFARKSLEAICVDQKAAGRDLKSRIDNLAQKGAIPPRLRDAAHSVRLLGNEGAHELDAEVSQDDAETLLALCDAIIGYVYDAPQLIQRIQDRLGKP